MNQTANPEWKAQWIWGSGEPSPRNEWRCFRRAFKARHSVQSASIRISADSRYVLYIDGKPLGRGPVRSWPFAWSNDEYEIGHLLEPGKETVIAVLVMHYGISTFQYLRGRGGLLVQLDIRNAESGLDSGLDSGDLHPQEWSIVTDSSWKTAIHRGHDPNSSRISCQMAFTESSMPQNGMIGGSRPRMTTVTGSRLRSLAPWAWSRGRSWCRGTFLI